MCILAEEVLDFSLSFGARQIGLRHVLKQVRKRERIAVKPGPVDFEKYGRCCKCGSLIPIQECLCLRDGDGEDGRLEDEIRVAIIGGKK